MAKGWVLRTLLPVMANEGWSMGSASVFFVSGGNMTPDISKAHVFGAEHEAEYTRDRYGYSFDVVPLDRAEAEYVAQKINE